MRVAFRRVKEEIADTSTRYVLMLWCDVREDEARRNLGAYPSHSGFPEVVFTKVRESEEP